VKNRINITGFNIIESLGESMPAEVFKVSQHDDNKKLLVLKRIKPEFADKKLRALLSHRYNQIKEIKLKGLIKPTLHLADHRELFFTQKYYPGETLSQWMKKKGSANLADFFAISTNLSQILNSLHNSGMFHEAIKPDNILIHPESLDIRLIDPIRILDINELSHYIDNEVFRISTLPYISPEQTGKIKQLVGYETDMYSIGIVFYELLTGALPFYSENPIEIIHSHLAHTPKPVNKINQAIPEMVARVIAKLLAKEPEKRYQDTNGLFYDLCRCKENFEKNNDITLFTPGLTDFSDKITLPSIMVGRDNEKKLLLTEHKRSCQGEFRFALISGLPGIGKTRLIQELERPIIASRGYFTSGKFDQYQKNVPYSSLIQAFKSLVKIILTESKKRVDEWKKKISSAIGINGRLITDIVPDLTLITGKLPKVATIPPVEAIHRFKTVVENFITSLAGPKHPLTLFIDDLQWCDTPTFEIMENLIANAKNHPYLFLIGAYRHNKVDKNYPLSRLLGSVKKKAQVTEIRLNKLQKNNVNDMVAYILNDKPSKVYSLTDFVNTTAAGNPLYINETLSWMHNNKIINRTDNGRWQWDESQLIASKLPALAVDFFSYKIKTIPGNVLEILQIASCLGTGFSADELCAVLNSDMAKIYAQLAPVFKNKILVKRKKMLFFSHDRIQEAVYSTIDKRQAQTIHKNIAETLLKLIPEKTKWESVDNLFTIANHLNKGRPENQDSKNQYRDAKLNYYAGKKAVAALATETANQYYLASKALITEDVWNKEYDFAYALYKELATNELTTGKQSNSEKLLNELIKRSKTALDQAECLAEQATVFLSFGDINRSISTANKGLAYFNKMLPEKNEDVLQKIKKIAADISRADISPADIIKRKPLDSREKLIELTLYNQLIPAYYRLGQPNNFFLAALQATYSCLFSGIDHKSIYPFSIYSLYLLEQGIYDKAFQFEKLVIELCAKFPNTFGQIRGMDYIAWLSLHWKNTFLKVFNYSCQAIEAGKRSGDTYHTGLAYCSAIWSAIMQGFDLEIVGTTISNCIDFSEKYNIPFSHTMAETLQVMWLDPMTEAKRDHSITENVVKWQQTNDYTLIGNYYIFAGMAQYLLGNIKLSSRHFETARQYLPGHQSNLPNRIWHIFYVLSTLGLARLAPFKNNENAIETIIKDIQPLLKNIELWTGFGPALKPYLALIHAELKRVSGDFKNARNLYFDAIDMANEQEYTLLEGFIHETLGEFLFQHSSNQADYHIKKAADQYKKCHAKANFNLIQKRYFKAFSRMQTEQIAVKPLDQKLDAKYLMKATKAIYQELEIDELLKVVLHSLMERVGARTGYLLTAIDGNLIIRVKGVKEGDVKVILEEEPLSEQSGLSLSMVRYVQRTKKILILENAAEKGIFSNEKQTMELKLRSVLFYPIIHQQKLIGIVCLQNKLIKSVFVEEQIEIVRQLSTHAAIALENLRYRDLLEDLVQERTKKLKKTQEQLITAERLAVLGQFSGNISHEIRNPLGVIDSSVFFLKKKLKENNLKVTQHLNRIKKSVQRCTDIIESMRRLTQTKELITTTLNVANVCNEAISSLKVPPEIKIIKTFPAKKVLINGDREQLRITVKNIVDNAVEAMENKGIITIQLEPDIKNQLTRLTIKDTGPGILQDNLENIFKPLFSTKNSGIGFGLSISRRIVEKHGGMLSVKSEHGKGAAFIIKLPL